MAVWLRRMALTGDRVDRRGRRLAGGDRAARRCAPSVPTQAGQGERGVEHLGRAGLGGDRAGVADLAAALGVERGAVEEDLDGAVGPASTREDPSLGGVVGVADELGGAELLDELAVALDRRRRRPRPDLRAALARSRCWVISALKPSMSTSTPRSRGDLGGHLEREAVGVVEGERGVAGQASSRRPPSSRSRMPSPVFRVWRKRSSSRVITPSTKSRFLTRSG